MKRILISLAALAAVCAAQGQKKEAEPQAGTPAVLEAINGKKARVFLQRVENSKLVFQPYKSTREISVDTAKVKRLEFILKYDSEGVSQAFIDGDYAGVIATLEPLLKAYSPYMVVDNNLRDAFAMLMKAYRENGELPKARQAATVLLQSGNPALVQRGQVVMALAAIADNDLPQAEKIQGEVPSEAAALYLKASIEQAKGEPKAAIKTVVGIIAEHGNDMDWLPPAELLSARLYLDMGMTNSAAHTARQVENIYAGTHISADAKKLREPLNVEEPEPEPEPVVEEEPAGEGMEAAGSETNAVPAAESIPEEPAPEPQAPSPKPQA